MFEYKFVRVAASFERSAVSPRSYEPTVVEHAAQGWRLVQILVANPAAVPTHYELIFERPAGK